MRTEAKPQENTEQNRSQALPLNENIQFLIQAIKPTCDFSDRKCGKGGLKNEALKLRQTSKGRPGGRPAYLLLQRVEHPGAAHAELPPPDAGPLLLGRLHGCVPSICKHRVPESALRSARELTNVSIFPRDDKVGGRSFYLKKPGLP